MMAKEKKKDPAQDSFHKELEKALKKVHDAPWLGEHSPLAAPYFLGEYLLEQEVDASNPVARGEVLQKLLGEEVAALAEQGEKEKLYSDVLRLAYFEDWMVPKIAMELGMSEATYHRYRTKGIRELALILNRRLMPALRLESPTPQEVLIGRDEVQAACLAALLAGKSVGLHGAGGVGKTALGVHIAAQMAPQPVFSSLRRCFWLTFRLGINDEPRSFLFELAHFFARQGRSSLWAELVAQQGSGQSKAPFDMNIALASVRYDLQRLASCEGSAASPPLFCFDEIDLLRPTEFEAHATLLAFLESLRGLTPLLFIGQQLPLAVDQAHQLTGLELCSMAQMLNRAHLTLEPSQLEQLQRQTQGNPRLLELFIELHRSGEGTLTEGSDLFSGRHLSVEFLLRRIWRRLSSAEQEMLTFLVPFRRAAPRDAFGEPEEQAALQHLIERRLVQEHSLGEIALLPAFRGVLHRWLSGERRQTVHLNAATIRAKRGEYTAATYHCLQAGRTQLAFRLWHSHREEEINQGQAIIALKLFEGIADEELSKEDQEALTLLRAELLKISGDYERSEDIVRAIEWQTPALKAKAKRIEGDIAELRGELDIAMNAYRAGLKTTDALLSEKAQFHKNLGWVAKHQNKLDDAWRQALLAHYEAENLKGYVQERMDNYDIAREHYIKALTLGEQAGYDYGYANTCNNLGGMLPIQGEFEQAEAYLEQAEQYFKQRGQLNKLASVRVNQTFLYLLSRQHQAAIAPAQEALEIFERLGEPWGSSVARLNLAEAYLGVQAWDNAAACAEQLIQSEMRAAHYAWWVLGEVWLARHDYPQASDCLQQARKLAQEHNNRFLAGYVHRTQSKLYHAQGKPQAAQHAFEQAIERFEALNLPDEVARTREECG